MIRSPVQSVSGKPSIGAAPLTIFALPKPFLGHIAIIQRNAISSWKHLHPVPEIILFGDEPGTAEVAQELAVRHAPAVARNEFGTPLLDDLFKKAQALAAHDTLCYVNSDIVLLDDFMWAVDQVASLDGPFLVVGRRIDLDIRASLAFKSADWQSQLRRLALQQGRPQKGAAIDYFVFRRGLYADLPPFALGRFLWDNWLIWKARSLGAIVIDATPVLLAIHQNHDYFHYPGGVESMRVGVEAQRNRKLGCEGNSADFEAGLHWRYFCTIDDATHRLTPEGMKVSHRHTWKVVQRSLKRPRSMARLLGRALARAFT